MKISSACRQRPYTLPGKCNRTPDTWCHIGSWYLLNLMTDKILYSSFEHFSIFSTRQKVHHRLIVVVTAKSLLKSKTTTLKSILHQNELNAHCQMRIAHCPLLIAYDCQMPTAHCSLPMFARCAWTKKSLQRRIAVRSVSGGPGLFSEGGEDFLCFVFVIQGGEDFVFFI